MQADDQFPLATQLLEILLAEESLLSEALTSLIDLSDDLRRGDLQAVASARPRQESLAFALAATTESREKITTRMASQLAIPAENANISSLVSTLPEPIATELLAIRDRLRPLAEKVSTYQERNAKIIRHLRSYFRGVIGAIVVSDAPIRYTPLGTSLILRAGTLIQTRG